jgi:hypothetical protein
LREFVRHEKKATCPGATICAENNDQEATVWQVQAKGHEISRTTKSVFDEISRTTWRLDAPNVQKWQQKAAF